MRELRSLVRATEIDVLPPDRVVEREADHLIVRSPTNPAHYWGNLLIFDEPPRPGERPRWEALFDDAFHGEPRVRHRTFTWDKTGGEQGAAGEFVAAGYDLEETIGLVAAPAQIRPHERANREVVVRVLDPAEGADTDLWDAVVELQVAGREEGHAEDDYRAFTRARLAGRREHFRAGRGAWYAAIDPGSGDLAGSLGIVVTDGRGRYQVVDTAEAYRRRGIASRLVVDAARHAAASFEAERLVIAADPGYHALALYESLGFAPVERTVGVCLWPHSA